MKNVMLFINVSAMVFSMYNLSKVQSANEVMLWGFIISFSITSIIIRIKNYDRN